MNNYNENNYNEFVESIELKRKNFKEIAAKSLLEDSDPIIGSLNAIDYLQKVNCCDHILSVFNIIKTYNETGKMSTKEALICRDFLIEGTPEHKDLINEVFKLGYIYGSEKEKEKKNHDQ